MNVVSIITKDSVKSWGASSKRFLVVVSLIDGNTEFNRKVEVYALRNNADPLAIGQVMTSTDISFDSKSCATALIAKIFSYRTKSSCRGLLLEIVRKDVTFQTIFV